MSEESPTAREVFAGSTLEIDAAGDYIIDTHEALGGDVRVHLSPGRSFLIQVDATTVFEVTNDGSRTRIDIGGGAGERVVLGDSLKALLNDFFTRMFDLHIHPTPMGPSGPPFRPSPALR